ncbi:transcription factor Ken [Eupeodes corollae]|uniref:transcription factor Ken n=1 Tax=Eupeodes corollae TaxID=290404 RepID=UPI0024907085|nr:transcription factor Ken [Eupeodes corollae]
MNHLKWMGHTATILDIQKALKNDPATCDITLTCRGKSVKANRFVLCSCSDLLRDILNDVPVGQEATIIVPDIKGTLLDSVLSFVYMGETSLSSTNLSDFLEAINVLGIKSAISFECATSYSSTNIKNVPEITEMEEELMEAEPEQEIVEEKDEEEDQQTCPGDTNVRDLEFLEVYNEQDKISYTIENITPNNPNEYILTESSGTFTLTPNMKIESTAVGALVDKADEETHLMEQYVNDPIGDSSHCSSADQSQKETKPNKKLKDEFSEFQGLSPDERKDISRASLQNFNETQSARVEALENAVLAVVDEGKSLQKAAIMFNISKTVLWRRVKKHPLYMKTTRENPLITAACERLKSGDSLKSISQALDIPMSTLHRHKVRLAQEGRLPDYVTFKKRGPLSKEVLKAKLNKAVSACLGNGMSQNHAANVFNVPKSTLWRHLQKKMCSSTDDPNSVCIKEEIISPEN